MQWNWLNLTLSADDFADSLIWCIENYALKVTQKDIFFTKFGRRL
jgi:hypothetical protein